MLDQANRIPYDRTLLSKYQPGSEKTPLQTQSFYQNAGSNGALARWRYWTRPVARFAAPVAEVIAYDAALIATGGTSMALTCLARIFLLWSTAAADAILAQADRSERPVVIGLGFIGMEVAASPRERGLAVTVVGQEPLHSRSNWARKLITHSSRCMDSKGWSFASAQGFRHW